MQVVKPGVAFGNRQSQGLVEPTAERRPVLREKFESANRLLPLRQRWPPFTFTERESKAAMCADERRRQRNAAASSMRAFCQSLRTVRSVISSAAAISASLMPTK